METLEILKNALNSIKRFSHDDIDEENFNLIVVELKATTYQIKSRIIDEKQLFQLNEIIGFKTISQRQPLEKLLIRCFSPVKYGWPILRWNKKGKYVYDLDRLELKLGGLIYKLEQEELG